MAGAGHRFSGTPYEVTGPGHCVAEPANQKLSQAKPSQDKNTKQKA